MIAGRELPSGEERLDEGRLVVRLEQPGGTRARRAPDPRPGTSRDALAGPLGDRLQNSGNGKSTASTSARRSTSRKSEVGTPLSRRTRFAIPLWRVRQADQRIGEGVADPVRLEQRRDLRLAPVAADALAHVEHASHVSPRDSAAASARTLPMRTGLVAERPERRLDRRDRLLAVELRRLLVA